MRLSVLALLFGIAVLLAVAATPQTSSWSTQAQQEYAQALTDAGFFGAPRRTTALLPPCDATNIGAISFNTTLAAGVVCTGAAWSAMGVSAGGTVTGDLSFNSNIGLVFGLSGEIKNYTNQVPDSLIIAVGTANSNSLGIAETADVGTGNLANCGAEANARVSPGICIHSTNFSQAEYTAISSIGEEHRGATNLTEGSATTFANVGYFSSGRVVGGRVDYSVKANDASAQYQIRGGGWFTFAMRNESGTPTCVTNPAAPDQTNDGNAVSVTSGTLTYAITCVVSGTNIAFRANATSSLTQTVLQIDGKVTVFGFGQVYPP